MSLAKLAPPIISDNRSEGGIHVERLGVGSEQGYGGSGFDQAEQGTTRTSVMGSSG